MDSAPIRSLRPPSTSSSRMEALMRGFNLASLMQQLNEIHEDEDDGTHVPIRLVQFGCLDYDESSFSIEWEERFNERDAYVVFDGERREMCVKMRHGDAPGRLSLVAMRFSHIKSLSAPPSRRSQDSTLTIVLSVPPSFESETKNRFLRLDVKRTRLQHLPFGDHKRVVAFTSFALRLELPSQTALRDFRKLAKDAGLWHPVDEYDCPTVRDGVYAQHVLDKVRAWITRAPWCIAFQLASLLCGLLIRPGDLLSLEPQVREMQERFGEQYCARFLRYFQERLVAWVRYEDDAETVRECFDRAARDFERGGIQEAVPPTNASLFQSLHAIVTPTRIILQGPYPERSNRVIRMFDAQHHDSFLRVSFTEETKLQYRFDREVDTASFVRSRVGGILKKGLVIAGREFEFLAYSQSALKEHTVYFVKPFRVGDTEVNAASIIASIGNFENSSDRFCPARYAARLSQAFTATDASIVVKPAETRKIADISTPDGMYYFTDGVGTMSREMAVDAYTEVRRYRKHAMNGKGVPAAFQIRFMGSKGMLSVDYTLQGRVVCLRDSMIKFDCPNNRNLEIARVFDRPAKYYLNRPLIMLLEGLGVPYETFFQHQNAAVQDAYSSTESLTKAARMLEALGLGTSFRLPSVLLNLVKHCDIENIVDNKFYSRMLEFAIHHVLRELKNHARIPIPGAYTLVGVADVHGYLKEWEIFACIKPHDSDEVTFLEGDVLISRSPSIHPGDVQIARAIGSPKPGSPFAREPLANTVVFSVHGERPLASMLGGGDLDGDEYNLIPLSDHPEFRPRRIEKAASYRPAPRKTLSRAANMDDVSDFVVDYINNDVLGVVAITWLIIADQSSESIFDKDCLELAQLHSDAVDFPKSGQPVELRSIPRLRRPDKKRPDWNAPEVVTARSSDYYESQRAIGRLHRAITLPALKEVPQTPRTRRNRRRERRLNEASTIDWSAGLHDEDYNDPVVHGLSGLVSEDYDEITAEQKESTEQLFQRFANELRGICSANALSQSRAAMLTEEEAVVGTIVQQTPQPRKRKDHMTKLRDQTDLLVKGIRDKLEGDDGDSPEDVLRRAWHAWLLAYRKQKAEIFGAHGFGWVALGVIFEALKEIDERETPVNAHNA